MQLGATGTFVLGISKMSDHDIYCKTGRLVTCLHVFFIVRVGLAPGLHCVHPYRRVRLAQLHPPPNQTSDNCQVGALLLFSHASSRSLVHLVGGQSLDTSFENCRLLSLKHCTGQLSYQLDVALTRVLVTDIGQQLHHIRSDSSGR